MTPLAAVKPDYALYLEAAKRAELVEELQQQGYAVETNKSLDDVKFDLLATKDGKTKAFELRSVGNWKFDRESFRRVQEKARSEGFEFHIVVVNPPPRVNVEIDDLNRELQHYMAEGTPEVLASLSDRVEIKAVYDLKIEDIRIGSGETRLAGAGTVQVEFADQIDAGIVDFHEDAFPFRFKAVLSANGHLKAVEELSIDTSTFYE